MADYEPEYQPVHWPNLGRSREFERQRAALKEQAIKDREAKLRELGVRYQHEELFGRPSMDLKRVIEVNRDEWALGQEVIVDDPQRDHRGAWKINDIDWSRGSGPILCERLGKTLTLPAWVQTAWFQPWHLTHVPTTLEEIEAFLGN